MSDLSHQDYAYIEWIRNRLWNGREVGRAAVMIGAGFSRNAERVTQTVPAFPLWEQLAAAFYDSLYPSDTFTGGQNHKKRKIANSGAMNIAQEYEAAFGRQALEERIFTTIPDAQYSPGDLHQLLLSLPWSDVFTTNYDTLLERTQLEIPERKYDIVISPDDIPVTTKPRIVKLHGSLSARPLTITTEDYRRYPARFAPFVNMVQQSMMENAFCLLGFSGDDPNFINWLGWVRDNLGEQAPTIFLCGLLDLSPSERKLLASKNIALLDLSPKFPKEEWPDSEARHSKALKWFLEELHAGKPPNALAWPSVGEIVRGSTENNVPKLKTFFDSFSGRPPTSRLTAAQLMDQADNWQSVRKHYPGWIVPPRKCRKTIWSTMEHWVNPVVFAINQELTGNDRILVLWELNWFLERSLTPLVAEWIEPITEALLDEVPFQQLVGASNLTKESRYSPAIDQHHWADLAFSVLKHFRRAGNDTMYSLWSNLLKNLAQLRTEWDICWTYEQCLYHMYRFEYDQVLKRLKNWPVTPESSYWNIRKAGLLAELGELDTAQELTERTLKCIRSLQQPYDVDHALLSQEGWAMFLSKAIRDADLTGDRDFYPEYRDRWDSLNAFQCNPWSEFDAIIPLKEVDDTEPSFKRDAFDPKRYSRGVKFTNNLEVSKYKQALELLVLFEEGGIPYHCGGLLIYTEEIKAAASQIYPIFPLWSIGAIVRTAKKDVVKEVFTRARVASLETNQVNHLVDLLAEGIKVTTRRLEGDLSSIHGVGQKERLLPVLSELLSRLCIRLDGEQLGSVLKLAIDMYRCPVFSRYHSLHECVKALFNRTLPWVSPDILEEHLSSLVALPIPGENGFTVGIEQGWPEPMAYLTDISCENLSPNQVKINSQNVDRLILLTKGQCRKIALLRIKVLYDLGLLNKEQEKRFAENLWSKISDKTGLPSMGWILLSEVLTLPSPQGVDPKSEFRRYLRMGTFVKNVNKTDKGLSISGGGYDPYKEALKFGVTNFLNKDGATTVTINEADRVLLLDKWKVWWDNEKQGLGSRDPFGTIRDELKQMITIMALLIMPELSNNKECSNKITELLDDMQAHAVGTERLIPFRLLYGMEVAEAQKLIEEGLTSENDETVRDTLVGIYYWYMGYAENILPSPPIGVLDALVSKVLMRKTPALDLSVDYLSELLRIMPEVFQDVQIRYLCVSLRYLLNETNLTQTCKKDSLEVSPNSLELPEIRRAAAKLSQVIAQFFQDKEQEIPSICAQWRETIKTDPLPEVRLLEV